MSETVPDPRTSVLGSIGAGDGSGVPHGLRLEDYDFELPPERIAQHPAEPRDSARLLLADRAGLLRSHHRVAELDRLLAPGDLLVLNRSRVFPARLAARKHSGGVVEILLVHPLAGDGCGERWRCLLRGKVQAGSILELAIGRAVVSACHQDGGRDLDFELPMSVLDLAQEHGRIPLPPYIRRPDQEADRERYQTVFADRPGSVAAPTAGLHLTRDLLARLARRGIDSALVDLAVGPGTFRPITAADPTTHQMHAEHASCPADTLTAMTRCREAGGRVIAVGTTVVRTLETAWRQDGGPAPWQGWTQLFLHPPATLASIDGLLTNFHLPRSTLLMLVACLCGAQRLMELYRQAIAADYRFYSYGDAMLLLPERR